MSDEPNEERKRKMFCEYRYYLERAIQANCCDYWKMSLWIKDTIVAGKTISGVSLPGCLTVV